MDTLVLLQESIVTPQHVGAICIRLTLTAVHAVDGGSHAEWSRHDKTNCMLISPLRRRARDYVYDSPRAPDRFACFEAVSSKTDAVAGALFVVRVLRLRVLDMWIPLLS